MNLKASPGLLSRALSTILFIPLLCATAAELRVSTDFEGGSARIESLDQESKVIRMMPGGDPNRGWPCWWFIRVDGVEQDERLTISLAASTLSQQRSDGTQTTKPLSGNWAMPKKATFSTDGETWRQTAPGRREENRISYEVTGTGGPLWIAWGPPFTPKDTDALITRVQGLLSAAKAFDLAQTREGRTVRGVRITQTAEPRRLGIWIQARQHAWESGSSWVARGLIEWLTSEATEARWLREKAEVVVVPIMDVDNVATGNGGKDAIPRDHNRDWADSPIYPEVAAAQRHLRNWSTAGRLDVFIDLHNPAPGDLRPFFFVGPEELLDEAARKNRADFLAFAQRRITAPLAVEEKPRVTGPGYHPLWRQISGQWVNDHASPNALAVCLETSWNTPHSTTEGYLTVGRQLGQTIVDYVRSLPE